MSKLSGQLPATRNRKTFRIFKKKRKEKEKRTTFRIFKKKRKEKKREREIKKEKGKRKMIYIYNTENCLISFFYMSKEAVLKPLGRSQRDR